MVLVANLIFADLHLLFLVNSSSLGTITFFTERSKEGGSDLSIGSSVGKMDSKELYDLILSHFCSLPAFQSLFFSEKHILINQTRDLLTFRVATLEKELFDDPILERMKGNHLENKKENQLPSFHFFSSSSSQRFVITHPLISNLASRYAPSRLNLSSIALIRR